MVEELIIGSEETFVGAPLEELGEESVRDLAQRALVELARHKLGRATEDLLKRIRGSIKARVDEKTWDLIVALADLEAAQAVAEAMGDLKAGESEEEVLDSHVGDAAVGLITGLEAQGYRVDPDDDDEEDDDEEDEEAT